jgi:serine protease
MTKNHYFAILAFIIGYMVNAQSLDSIYYYYKEQKIDLSVDKNYLNIITSDNFDETSIRSLGFKDFTMYEIDEFIQPQKFAKLEFENFPSDSEYLQAMDDLKRTSEIRNIGMFFKRGDSIPPIGTSNIFYVKLKNTEDFSLLQTTANQKGATIERQVAYMPEWYIISVNSPIVGTALEVSNKFFETKLFDAIDPAFMFDFGVKNPVISANQPSTPSPNCSTNDPYFNQQWGLKNTTGSTVGINICGAWEYTQGEGVKVAVIDNGISISSPHPDLEENIGGNGFNTMTYAAPSVVYNYPPEPFQLEQHPYLQSHGTHVAGIIAGVKNNNTGISGVAPQSKLYPVSCPFSFNGYEPDLTDYNISPTTEPISLAERLAQGISWAWQQGADVINNSWELNYQNLTNINSLLVETALDGALRLGRNGKGCVVIFSSGNISAMSYPGVFDDRILTVGAVLENGRRRAYPAGPSSGYGPKLDVVAPGEDIWSTVVESPLYKISGGTSMAAPHVSGIAALILSVNPCLTGQQVRDIIEQTAQKTRTDLYSYTNHPERPNGTWHEEVGYGLVDATAAVQLARSGGIDLYIRDTAIDTGEEPNTTSTNTYSSTDIWVRHLPDSGTGHQNPEYHPTNPNYVYVRVKNRGCVTSSGNDILNLYWSKAGTSMTWEDDWNGGQFPTGELRGDKIGYVIIPPVQGGQEIILEIPWNNIPNPEDYKELNLAQGAWHFCLLARIESEDDQMTFEETPVTGHNVRNNNNIAQTNISVIAVDSNSGTKTGATIAVGNPFNQIRSFHLNFAADTAETGRKIFEEAEVSIVLDEGLIDAWSAGGKIAHNITQADENTFMITGDNASLDNLVFAEHQVGTAFLQFNFLTQEVTEKELYIYHVVQEEALTNEVMGGEVYEIHREPRSLFFAYTGGNIQADKNQNVLLSAEPINEPALYNWYDSEGNLIYEGADFEVSVEIAQTYKLEIIALADGYKDYSEIQVSLNPNSIEALYPNPAATSATVTYKINEGESAYLAVTGFYGSNISNNYILDINQNTINLDISSFPQGLYAIALIVNGQIQNTTNLIKQ